MERVTRGWDKWMCCTVLVGWITLRYVTLSINFSGSTYMPGHTPGKLSLSCRYPPWHQ